MRSPYQYNSQYGYGASDRLRLRDKDKDRARDRDNRRRPCGKPSDYLRLIASERPGARIRTAVRRAFIASNREPISIADVLKRAYPRLKPIRTSTDGPQGVPCSLMLWCLVVVVLVAVAPIFGCHMSPRHGGKRPQSVD